MPYKDPDPTDPNMLVGVMLPADAEATRDMAYVFAEEFARLGYSREQLLWLFKNPFYGGAHGAYRALGEAEILPIIEECLNVWRNLRVKVQDVQIADQAVADVMLGPSEASQTESEILRRMPQDDTTNNSTLERGEAPADASESVSGCRR
jgi:hypothetical protein